jgi:hypothetical protein
MYERYCGWFIDSCCHYSDFHLSDYRPPHMPTGLYLMSAISRGCVQYTALVGDLPRAFHIVGHCLLCHTVRHCKPIPQAHSQDKISITWAYTVYPAFRHRSSILSTMTSYIARYAGTNDVLPERKGSSTVCVRTRFSTGCSELHV